MLRTKHPPRKRGISLIITKSRGENQVEDFQITLSEFEKLYPETKPLSMIFMGETEADHKITFFCHAQVNKDVDVEEKEIILNLLHKKMKFIESPIWKPCISETNTLEIKKIEEHIFKEIDKKCKKIKDSVEVLFDQIIKSESNDNLSK